MKKFLSLLLAFILILGCITVSAAEEGTLDFLKTSLVSYESEGTMSIKFNKPLQILDLIEQESSSVNMPFDLKVLVDSLFKTKISFTEKTMVENDGAILKSQIEYKTDMPLVFSDNLSADIKAKQAVWMAIDNGDIRMIQESPVANQYIYYDYSDIFSQDVFADASFNIPEITDYVKFSNDMLDIMANHCTVKRNGNKVKLTVGEDDFKTIIIDILKYFELEQEQIDETTKALVSVQLFDDNAIECEYKLNRQGRIESSKAAINIKANVYDIIAQSDGDTTGLERDKSYIDFSINAEAKFKYTNVKVNIPELTEENSYNPYQIYQTPEDDMYGGYYEDYTYSNCYAYIEGREEYITALNTEKIPLNKIIEGLTIDSRDISNATINYADGIIKIEDPEDNFYLHIAAGTNHVWYKNTDIYLDNPVAEENGIYYITPEFMEKVFGMELSYTNFYYDDYSGYIEFEEIYYEEV